MAKKKGLWARYRSKYWVRITSILDLSNGPALDRLRELPRDILCDLLYSYFH